MCKGTSLDACDTKAQGTQTTPSGAAKSEPQLFGIGTFSEPRLLTSRGFEDFACMTGFADTKSQICNFSRYHRDNAASKP